MSVWPVILSGGSGSRLWPLSREHLPKQLLPLTGQRTMLQATAARTAGLGGVRAALVVCNEAHRFMVAEQLRAIDRAPADIILEPVGRNTAPAVAAAALRALEDDPDAVLLVQPADHVIADEPRFRAAVDRGRAAAADGALVTFGIAPTRAETGYGYIQAAPGEAAAAPVQRFVEKPDAATAQQYVASGEYYWNSGMFLFRAERYLAELERYRPEMLTAVRRACQVAHRDLDFLRLDATAFAASPSDSIDYAVMEQTDSARVVVLDAGWSDVGAWDALHEIGKRDDSDNVTSGDVIAHDAAGCYLRAESRLLAVTGLQDHLVIETADAVLVAPRSRAQQVKALVEVMRATDRAEVMSHRRVYRPWGWYEGLAADTGFQVKLIEVNPGASLSLQYHNHRAEHWVVVQGVARVTRDNEVFDLAAGASTYIPLGDTHRLENHGAGALRIIEVQSGNYLGEDDIVRIEDHYGRSPE